ALEHPGPLPAVLLIDEIDRADDDFEAFLLELLGEAAVTIPELGTVRATHPPIIVLTSNRTRDLHDAVKRRCLYQWIDYPSASREVEIVRRRVRGASETLELDLPALAGAFTQRLHEAGLPVSVERAIAFTRALTLTRPIARRRLYWTARAVFVSDRAEVKAFDRVFWSVFGGRDAREGE